MKAPIFMKFEIYIYKIVKNDQMIFHEDPCIHAHTRGVNVHARISSRKDARAHIYASCARLFARIFKKYVVVFCYYLMNVSVKFQKDPSFRCGEICKRVLAFKSHQFSMYFPYFHNNVPQKSSKMDNY